MQEGDTGEGGSIREQVIVDIYSSELSRHQASPGNFKLAVEYLLMSSATWARKNNRVGNDIPIPSY